MTRNPTPLDDEAERAMQEMTAAQENSVSKIPEVATLQGLLAKIDSLPDSQDGLDLRQFKRLAKNAGENFKTHLTAVLKLAS